MQIAAESRQEIYPAEARRPWFLAVEECQNYVNTRAFAELLAESRGYGLGMFFINQHLAQLDEDFRRALLTNTKVRVAFRSSTEDSLLLAREFNKITGERVKDRELDWIKIGRTPIPIGFKENYFSVGEEARQNVQGLHYAEDRLFWLHISGEPTPVQLRTVDIPRQQIAASRERAARLKALVYETQAREQPSLPPAVPLLPERVSGNYEWAGGDGDSVAAQRQDPRP